MEEKLYLRSIDHYSFRELSGHILFASAGERNEEGCVDGQLIYGYINHKNGLYFTTLSRAYVDPYGILRTGTICMDLDFSLPYDAVKCGVAPLRFTWDHMPFSEKICWIDEMVKVSYELELVRRLEYLDEFRNAQYPDDLLVLVSGNNCKPEGIWCRSITISYGVIIVQLLNEPDQDMGIHKGDFIRIALMYDEESGKNWLINIEPDQVTEEMNARNRKVWSLEDLEFSIRPYSCLKRAGINTLDDLLQLSFEELKNVRNLGKKGLEEILEKLKDMGLQLAEDEAW